MGKDSPPPPDYKGAAEATAASGQETNAQQTYANRPTVTTPWGSQTWQTSKQIDPSTGKPVTAWEQKINLDPRQQAALDDQLAITEGRSGAAKELLGQATDAFQRPFNWDDAPERAPGFDFGAMPDTQKKLNGSSGDYRRRAQDAITELQRPDLERSRAAAETRLANQGITKGSEAYEADMRAVSDNENRAHLQAIAEGRNESVLAFGQDMGAADLNNKGIAGDISNRMNAGSFNNNNRTAAIAEEAQRRGMTLNELNALLTGQQVAMPQIPGAPQAGKAGGTDYSGALNNTYMAQLDQSNRDNAASASTTSALASAAGIAAYFAFSDARLKTDVREVGILSSGVRVVHYRYRGRPRLYTGVIAQEVARVIPEAVVLHPSGYLMVDYSKVH